MAIAKCHNQSDHPEGNNAVARNRQEVGRFTVDTGYDRRTRSWVTAVTGPMFDVFDLDGKQVAHIYSGTKEGAAVAHAGRVAEMESMEAALRLEEQNGDRSKPLALRGWWSGGQAAPDETVKGVLWRSR